MRERSRGNYLTRKEILLKGQCVAKGAPGTSDDRPSYFFFRLFLAFLVTSAFFGFLGVAFFAFLVDVPGAIFLGFAGETFLAFFLVAATFFGVAGVALT